MRVFALLHGRAAIIRCIHQLSRQTLFHRVLATLARAFNKPANRQRLAPFRADFDRHLISGTTNAATAYFHGWLHVVHRFMEQTQRVAIGPTLLLERIHRRIDDRFGNALFPVIHEYIHEAAENDIAEFRIRQNLTLFSAVTTRHGSDPHFGRFAP